MKLRCYYAHPMSLYGTPQEQRDIAFLEGLGWQVVNPPDLGLGSDLDDYCGVASSCDLVAFRSLPDGSITSGVAKEIESNGRVIELPSGISRRGLTVKQTLEALAQSGQR